MKLYTQIEIPRSQWDISHHHKLLVLGSCFAQNVGAKLTQYKFDACINPFGISYNPLSIAHILSLALEQKEVEENQLIHLPSGLYAHWLFHGSFSHADALHVKHNINSHIQQAHHYIQSAKYLIITFGTSFVYTLKETQEVVNNCHKMHPNLFERRRISVESIVEAYKKIIEKICLVNKQINIIFTVSPIRHWRDGAHNNQLSKATLLLAINQIQEIFPDRTAYFPAYEILLDELRDYRFYDEDMIHPTKQTIEYCWERFSDMFFSNDTKEIISKWKKIDKLINHKGMHTDSKEYKLFIQKIEKELEAFSVSYPYIGVSSELELISQKK